MATSLQWSLGASSASVTLPKTGLKIEAAYRMSVDAQDLFDARQLLVDRLRLHGIIKNGLDSIEVGLSPEEAVVRGTEYLEQTKESEKAVWEACQIVLALSFDPPGGVDWRSIFPVVSQPLAEFCTAALNREGLDNEDSDNLRRGAMYEFGILDVEPDGTFRDCKCAEHHGRGKCPNWPPFDWNPKAKRVWNDWRTVAAGGKIQITLAYLEGRAILENVKAEIEAASIQQTIVQAQQQEQKQEA